jgi:ATP-dependent DNA helicase RecG
MDVSELRERIVRWENLHTEFKEWPVQPDDLAATIVAFANTDGGQLILGVAKDRTITGVGDPDRAARDVDNVAYNNCDPPVTIIQEVLWLEDDGRSEPTSAGTRSRAVLVVHIPKGDMRPYKTSRGVYYIKTSSGRRQASREELLRAFQDTDALSYDETPLLRLDRAAIDLDEVRRYLDQTGQRELGAALDQLLVNWGLVVNDHPTVAGIVPLRSASPNYPRRCSARESCSTTVSRSIRRAGFPTPWTKGRCGPVSIWFETPASTPGWPTRAWSPRPAPESDAWSLW